MNYHNATSILNRASHFRRDFRWLRFLQASEIPPPSVSYQLSLSWQQRQCRHLASIMITKLRLQDRDRDYPASIIFRKKTDMEYDPLDEPKGARPVGGRVGEVGVGVWPNTTVGSSYHRHPDDPTDDDIDVESIEDLIAQRNNAKRDRDFRRADGIRSQLKFNFRVVLNDRDCTWSTNSANVGPIRPMRHSLADDLGQTGHDYKLYHLAGNSISSLSEDMIHQLIAERMKCRLDRDFDRADAIQQQLIDAFVQLDDHRKLWRADGTRFVPYGYDYSYAPDAGPNTSSMPEEQIKELIEERFACKLSRDFESADLIEDDLGEVGVYLHDGKRLWRADGQRFGREREY